MRRPGAHIWSFSCASEKQNEIWSKVTKYEQHKNRDNIKRGGVGEREEIVLHPRPSVRFLTTMVQLNAVA
jgi:hypothetical protein